MKIKCSKCSRDFEMPNGFGGRILCEDCDGNIFGQATTNAYLAPNYCKVCGSKFETYEQGWYDEYTGKRVLKAGCSKYGCENHCDILGGCLYIRKWNWGTELVCERCGHKWGDYR